MKKGNFIAYESDNHDLHYFETEKDAVICMNEIIADNSDEGISEDMENGHYFIAKIISRTQFIETKNKKDYTDEEWEEEVYSSDFDRIGRVELKPIEEVEIIDYKEKYEKCINIIRRFDAGIIGMYDL